MCEWDVWSVVTSRCGLQVGCLPLDITTPAHSHPTPLHPTLQPRSLMKDMNSKSDLYRANAIRVLCRIIDSQMLLQIERYLKQVGAVSGCCWRQLALCRHPLQNSSWLKTGLPLEQQQQGGRARRC